MTRRFSRKCSECGQRTMAISTMPYSVKVKHDGREYTVEIPSLEVPKCSACENFVLDYEANRQIDRAFRRQAHLLTPEEIRAGRESLRLTQQEFADRIGVSGSTLSRWETGAQVQQRSLNRAMKAYFESEAVRQYYAHIESLETGHVPTVPQVRQVPSVQIVPPSTTSPFITATNTISGFIGYRGFSDADNALPYSPSPTGG